MATKSYWYVREHVGEGIFHLVDGPGTSRTWQSEPRVQTLCERWIAREDDKYDAQYEGDMIGWPTCGACFKRAE
jgi:hypothetical protein